MDTAVDSGGNVFVGGYFTTYKGVSANHLVRLDTYGTRDDTTFKVGTGFNDNVRSITLDANGKILVGGDFTTYKGSSAAYIVRLDTNGDLLQSIGTGLNGLVSTIAVQSDGKILAGGYFTTYNGEPAAGIIRFNADGTRDDTFVQSGAGLKKT